MATTRTRALFQVYFFSFCSFSTFCEILAWKQTWNTCATLRPFAGGPNAMTGETWRYDVEGGVLADFESHRYITTIFSKSTRGRTITGPRQRHIVFQTTRREHWERVDGGGPGRDDRNTRPAERKSALIAPYSERLVAVCSYLQMCSCWPCAAYCAGGHVVRGWFSYIQQRSSQSVRHFADVG